MLKRHPLAAYYVLALAISWACWVPMAVSSVVVGPGWWPTHAPGLLGPAIAALLVAGAARGPTAFRELTRALRRWRIGLWPAVVVASPVILFGVAVLAGGRRPAWGELGQMNGFPSSSPLALWLLLVLINGLGEETGWRWFAFSELRKRHGWLAAALLVAPVWALWHVPSFFVLETYRGFGPGALVGFAIGILSGAVTLGWLYEKSRGSLLAVALWHGTFNLFTATQAARGVPAAVETTAVIVFASAIVVSEIWTRHHGRVVFSRP